MGLARGRRLVVILCLLKVHPLDIGSDYIHFAETQVVSSNDFQD